MLIPPSVLLIIWAILTEGSVGALFIAGIIPGILLASAFIGYNVYRAKRNPDIAPAITPSNTESPANENDPALGKLDTKIYIGGLGIIFLILLVLGGIWGGVFTPTEAAGFGVIGGIIIAAIKGLGIQDFKTAIIDAGRTSAPIMFLLIAGSMYARLLAVSGGVTMINDFFTTSAFSIVIIILIMTVIWLLLGMLVDSISIILLTVPIFVPLAVAAGINEVAFAIYGILIIEAGLLTPPVGLLVYTVKSAVPDKTVKLSEIFRGSVPYWILILIVAVTVLSFPALATWLPNKTF